MRDGAGMRTPSRGLEQAPQRVGGFAIFEADRSGTGKQSGKASEPHRIHARQRGRFGEEQDRDRRAGRGARDKNTAAPDRTPAGPAPNAATKKPQQEQVRTDHEQLEDEGRWVPDEVEKFDPAAIARRLCCRSRRRSAAPRPGPACPGPRAEPGAAHGSASSARRRYRP